MRIKIIPVSKEMMARFLTADVRGGWKSSAPSDLKVLSVREGINPNVFEVICESEEFEDLQEYEVPPTLILSFKYTP